MPPRTSTYYFGRINIVSSDNNISNKKDFILSTLKAGNNSYRNQFTYGFFDVLLIDPINEFICGDLVKWRPELENEVVDRKEHRIQDASIPDAVVGKSDFFIHVPSGIIGYHPIINKISDKQFRDIFKDLFENANSNFFVDLKFEAINEQFTLLNAITGLDKIYSICFEVHPTNPNNRPVYDKIDQRIKELNAGEYSSEIKARSDAGLNKQFLANDEFVAGLNMVADGYGDAKVEGEKENRKITITSNESPMKKNIEKSDDKLTILNRLIDMFNRIRNHEN